MSQPDDPGVEFMNPEKVRLLRILGRHARKEDMGLSDREFAERLFGRWRAALAEPLIDPNE